LTRGKADWIYFAGHSRTLAVRAKIQSEEDGIPFWSGGNIKPKAETGVD